MRSLLRYSIAPLFLIASACGGEPPPPAGETVDFDLKSQSNEAGYPDGFDYGKFISDIQPILITKCAAAAGCHDSAALHPLTAGVDPAAKYGSYTVWKDAKADAPKGSAASNNLVKNFNHFIHQSDYADPAGSILLVKATGATPHLGGLALASDSAEYTAILQFMEAAKARRGDPVPEEGEERYFDRATFDTVIQPIFDSTGCSATGTCHGMPGSAGSAKFALVPNATAEADLKANFLASVQKSKLIDTDAAVLYIQATVSHQASPVLSSGDAATLLDWIQDAAEAKCGTDENPSREGCPENEDVPPPTGCVPEEQFNFLAFKNDILPILDGDFDYNDPNGENGIPTGCSRGPCHGNPALDTEGSLFLGNPDDASDDRARKALASFGCFVNLNNPAFSQVLLCPLDSPNCIKNPHPGMQIFQDTDDLNYQRIASFIAASSKAPPYDFAFFVEKVSPIFFTPNADNQTCADTGQCHGVTSAGQVPPNGSDFPILPGADIAALTYNFIQAGAFANFFDAAKSPLLLYPTDTIGDLVPGIIHPPGAVIDINDQAAIDIETWAGGLRFDANGFNLNWLVAGEYLVQDINDEGIGALEDGDLNPRIFDTSGGVGECQGSPCEWEAVFSAVQDIDLNNGDGNFDGFNRDVSIDRAAYAVAYIVNISGVDIDDATIEVTTVAPNDLKVFVNGALAGTGLNGNTATAAANFPTIALGEDAIATQVVIKIFQPAGEDGNNFTFNARFLDDQGNPIDADDDVIVLLNSYEEGI